MIAPEVPTGDLIRQAVLDNESHRQGNNAVGVMGLGQCVVGHVRVEILAAPRAPMLRVNQVDVARPTGNQIPNVMKDSFSGAVAKARSIATGARSMREVAATFNNLGSGQIFGSRNAFRDVRQILSGARHSKALLGQLVWPRNLQDLLD
jgi:hypothetical protein